MLKKQRVEKAEKVKTAKLSSNKLCSIYCNIDSECQVPRIEKILMFPTKNKVVYIVS